MNVQSKNVIREEYFQKVDFLFQDTPCSTLYEVLYIRDYWQILRY